MLTEAEGCAILKRVFTERGYAIQENVYFSEDTVSFTADGWDSTARVGYEYMTTASRDHEDLDPDELRELIRRMEAGELFFFLIDEMPGAEELEWAASRFLDEVARRRGKTP